MTPILKTISILFLTTVYVTISAQESNILKRANSAFQDFAYHTAIEEYEEYLKQNNGSVELLKKLGDSYFYNADLSQAARWYKEMLKSKDTLAIEAEYYFRAAQSYKYLEKYEEAAKLMDTVRQLSSEDSRAIRLLKTPDYLATIEKQSGRYQIINLDKNSKYTDFAPSFFNKNLVFSSSRKEGTFSGQQNEWTAQPYLQLYESSIEANSSISYPLGFAKKFKTRLHESTTAFSKDGSVAYFTRNNIVASKLQKDTLNVVRLKIFRAVRNAKLKWKTPKSLDINDDNYSIAHPAFSPDEKKLYFASDMPGGYGMSDLYVVNILENGELGTPKNLGSKINTEGRDTFPFVSSSGHLYFTSDGHLGLGGMDIFTVQLEDPEQKIYNVGRPINSPADDVTFIIDDETRKGYFASNRPGGQGDDDIYSFIQTKSLVTECIGSINGIAVDDMSGALLTNAAIRIYDQNSVLLYEGITNAEGRFSHEVDCNNKNYKTHVAKDNYDPVEETIALTPKDPNPIKMIRLKNTRPEKGVDLAKLLALKPIYFESNKVFIIGDSSIELDKVVDFMKKYPTLHIEIGSHTDSRGSDAYNEKLSSQRALATANYVISKGIDL